MEEALPTLAGNKLSTALFVNSILPPRYAGEHKSPETDLMQKAVFASWIPIIDGYPVIPKFRCDLVGETTAFDLEMVEHTFTLERTQAEECLESKIGKTLIPGLFRGESATVMLYGQSGIGKEELFSGDGSRLPNIVDWCASKIFSEIPENCEVVVSVAMVANYLDGLSDLLTVKNRAQPANVVIRELKNQGMGNNNPPVLQFESQTWYPVNSVADLNQKFRTGLNNIPISTTYSYVNPARDIIFSIGLDIRKFNNGSNEQTAKLTSKFTIVCLKGSERTSKSGISGLKLQEAKSIGLSLSSLGNCIHMLARQSSAKEKMHIPYRDSKLTRYLQPAFMTERLVLMGFVSCFKYNQDESVSTMRFLGRFNTISAEKAGLLLVPHYYGQGALLDYCSKNPAPETSEESDTDSHSVVLLNDPCRRSIVGKRFHRGCILKGTKKQQQ